MSWMPTPEELHMNWVAFQRLHQKGLVTVGLTDRQEGAAIKSGWVKIWHFFSVQKTILNRMLQSAPDFHTGYERFGVDIVWKKSGNLIMPWQLLDIWKAEENRPPR